MKLSRLIILASSSLLLSGCTLPFVASKAGIQITANPQASVFMDNKSLGQTPIYQNGLKAGTYNIKISASDTTIAPWEGKVTLNPSVLTVIDRELTSDPTKAHGYTLTFEKLINKTATEVNLVSFPDTVSVMADGAPVGFTPFKSDSIAEGAHTFTLTSPGYQDIVIKASVKSGYRLVINAQLATQSIIPTPSPEATPSPTPTTISKAPLEITPLPKQASNSAILKPFVTILETPTKFLRVRDSANASGNEVAKVNPGDKFPYLQTNGSWYQIEYQTGSNGWISASYAKLSQ